MLNYFFCNLQLILMIKDASVTATSWKKAVVSNDRILHDELNGQGMEPAINETISMSDYTSVSIINCYFSIIFITKYFLVERDEA